MDEKFEIEVLTRLAVIENKIDDYNNMKEKLDNTYNIAKNNREEIIEIVDRNKWLWRTTIGAFLTGIVGLIFIYLKIGLKI